MRNERTRVFGIENKARRWSLALLIAVTFIAGAALSGTVGGKQNADSAGQSGNSGGGTAAAASTHVTMEIDWKVNVNKTKAFEIKDFSFGVENPTTIGSATGGAGAGKVKFNEFTIKKTPDALSPRFFQQAATGDHIREIVLNFTKVDKKGHETTYMTFQFQTVFTTKVDWSGPGDEGPEESITFVYGTLQVTYHQQDPTTGETTDTTFGWDQVQNKAFP